MRQPDNELRQKIEIAIASAQNVPFVGPNQQRIARSLLSLITEIRTAALEEAAEIAESRHQRPIGASTDGSVTYQSTAKFPDDGRQIATAIRAAKVEPQ
jgi:hypothetical protein